ncbi:hypothetical protein [Bacillus sp. MMSF_3328]|uniref:S8 family serine peptidase n=1 Tax=Bacillus TaxID=1386 RepID=UPI00273EA86C|nr:hypothetical protein [Bacillus sp. MMSF_3328]
MTKLRKSLLVTVSVLILLSIGLLFIVPNTRNKENPENKTVAVENKFNPTITNVQNVKNEKNVLQINSLSMGQTIKNQLKNDPSVFLIKHNEKTESHYIKKEVNVTFKTLPSTKEIKRITQEINGTIIKKLNSTIVFRSNTLSTKELIEYFNRQAMVEFAEPNFICKIKLDFLMICYIENNTNGTYRQFKQKQAGISPKGMNISLLLL